MAEFLQQARHLPIAGLRAITEGRALILAPHPDDESLGCGGLIAQACAAGQPPFVAILTDGAGSHPRSAEYPAPRLRATRQAETVAAIACLGLGRDHVAFLDYPDTRAPLEGAPLLAAADRVASLAQQQGCRTILAPWQHDPHCDHLAGHRIAAAAAAQAGLHHRAYPVWGLTLPGETLLSETRASGLRLDVAHNMSAKRRAVLCHRSQYAGLVTDDPGGFQMTPSFLALFEAPNEIYLDPA